MNTLEYVAALFRAESQRLRAEVDPASRLMDGRTHNDKLADSLDRMASKAEETAATGVVEEVA